MVEIQLDGLLQARSGHSKLDARLRVEIFQARVDQTAAKAIAAV